MTHYFLHLLLILCAIQIQAQTSYVAEIREWQRELNEEYADPKESPLPKKELKKFKSLEFFPINEQLRVEASLEHTPFSEPFTIPTTTERLPVYVQYAIARFTINDTIYALPIYQNLQLRETEEYKDYLFAPFTDQTNGYTTYGGGRYLDLKIPEGKDKIILDFNKAYNPYCAYNAKYSCPIPPRENDLALKVEAGVKAWDK